MFFMFLFLLDWSHVCIPLTFPFMLLCRRHSLFFYVFLSLHAIFRSLEILSFHHLLLNGQILFLEIVSIIAFLIAVIRSDAILSMMSALYIDMLLCFAEEGYSLRRGRYSLSLIFSASQLVFSRLNGCDWSLAMNGFRLIIVSIGRWSDPWLLLFDILHLMMPFSAYLFPHTKFNIIFILRKMIVSVGSSRSSFSCVIAFTHSSASLSCTS